MRYYVWIAIAIVILVIIIIAISLILIKKNQKTEENIETEAFDSWKKKIDANCDEDLLRTFMYFIKKYGGGYVRYKNSTVIERRYRGQELSDLKDIFVTIIIPSVKIGIKLKEEFRENLVAIGVSGLEKRPFYEQKNENVKTYVDEFDEERRKLAKTRGARIMRTCLRKLNPHRFYIVNDIELEYEGVKKKIDHILIGDNAVFILEAKPYGMSDEDDDDDEASLYIDKSDKWLLRKYSMMCDIPSPNQNMLQLQKYMKDFCLDVFLDTQCIMVLANPELKMKQNMQTDYMILSVNELVEYIENYRGVVTENDKQELINKLNKYRVN